MSCGIVIVLILKPGSCATFEHQQFRSLRRLMEYERTACGEHDHFGGPGGPAVGAVRRALGPPLSPRPASRRPRRRGAGPGSGDLPESDAFFPPHSRWTDGRRGLAGTHTRQPEARSMAEGAGAKEPRTPITSRYSGTSRPGDLVSHPDERLEVTGPFAAAPSS